MAFPILTALPVIGKLATGLVDAGKGVVNHFFPPKIGEKDLYELSLTETDIERKDAASARLLAMVEVRFQRKPWLVRLINGLFRPVIGAYLIFMASLCIGPGRWFWGTAVLSWKAA